MVTAVFPGSFDPPTYGHLNVIERASALFDTIDVLVSVNPGKSSLFSAEERVSLLKEMTKNFKNVQVHSCDTLVVEYAKKIGAKANANIKKHFEKERSQIMVFHIEF